MSEADRPAPVASLSVVVPAYNEEDSLGGSLREILDWAAQRGGELEVIVVDDGSGDRTSQIAAGFEPEGVRVVRFEANRGKGAAVRAGVLATAGELVLVTDADLSAPIREFATLEREVVDADVVIGSRAVEASLLVRKQPPHRVFMGAVFRTIVRQAGVGDIRDSQCGFKLLRGEAARSLFSAMVTDGFAFDVELLWLARRRGLRVREVGVAWADSGTTTVRWWIDPLKMLLEIVRFRWRHGRTPAGGPERGTQP